MEPLTAITMIAAKYGVSGVIGALTDNQELGSLSAELVGALSASEDRLGEKLAGIESQLDQVLDQRYSAALAAGLRTLLDAGATADPRVRADELVRARDLFREAGAAARSPLQVGIAERYLVLCAIALGRREAALIALGLLNKSALEALLGAMPLVGPEAYERARAQVGRVGFRSRREERIEELADEIIDAAEDITDLASSLLDEADDLAEALGHAPAPTSDVDFLEPEEDGPDDRISKIPQVVIRPLEPGPLRLGPLSVTWDAVQFRPAPGLTSAPSSAGAAELVIAAKLAAAGNQPVPPAGTLDVAVTVRTEPALSVPLHLTLFPPEQDPSAWWLVQASHTLPAGTSEIQLRQSLQTSDPAAGCTLSVNDVLLFRSA